MSPALTTGDFFFISQTLQWLIKSLSPCTRYYTTQMSPGLSHYRQQLFFFLTGIFQYPISHVKQQNGNSITWLVTRNFACRQVCESENYFNSKFIASRGAVSLLVWKVLSIITLLFYGIASYRDVRRVKGPLTYMGISNNACTCMW